ncbi:MAG: hypothetical protein ABIO49_13575 [Dokdonella sp.]
MNFFRLHRGARPPARSMALAIAILTCTSAIAVATEADAALAATPLAQAAARLQSDYRHQQWQRLSQRSDRDSLVAAVLLGMATESDAKPLRGNVDTEQRLAAAFGQDPLAAFTLALACEVQSEPCAHPEYYDTLVRIAGDNAVHWLLLPNAATPSDAQLHAAASADQADSHLAEVIGIVRAALADQPAPASSSDVDAHALASLLRRNAVDQVPLPKFAPTVVLCKTAVGERRADCIELAHHLIGDRSGAILTSMLGGVILRRLAKGTPDDAAAKESRRSYVWLSQQLEASKAAYQEQLQSEVVDLGEWEAWQRCAERLGALRAPPAGWMPQNPNLLLLSEDRRPAAH